ncbi:MAG: MFS transporter [Alphaproteobacteria bacterium]
MSAVLPNPDLKATRISLFSLKTIQMRTFHLTWMAFFLCFFGWFGIAPLMPLVREDLGLTKAQIGNTIIASVAITVFVRIVIGALCDKIGPRKAYTGLLVLGSIPVMTIGLAQSYETFLLFRLAIGAIGASFVITQYHTSMMFAPNVVGTANATTAGWGNLGGGITQMAMPVILTVVLMIGVEDAMGWRVAMIVPGIIMLGVAALYWKYTTDLPEGNLEDLPRDEADAKGSLAGLKEVAKDVRVWALFAMYGACFGVELTLHNIAALYFFDEFDLSLATAGIIAGLFGVMAIFARTLGGWASDKVAKKSGLQARVWLLGAVLLAEGIALIVFSQMTVLVLAVGVMLVFSLFVQMGCGATFGVVPFVNKKALGAVAGIVGAGGNAGAVMAGFLFKSEALTYQDGLFYMGCAVVLVSFTAVLVRFSKTTIAEENAAYQEALAMREQAAA